MDLAKAVRDPWVWGQLVLLVFVGTAAPLMPRYLNLGGVDFLLNRIDPLWIRSLGAIPMALGGLVSVWGLRSLGPNLTPGTEPLSHAKLVTAGAYSHARHPIYAGLVLFLAGYTLAWSNWTFALLIGIISLKYFEAKAGVEERWLLERFPGYTTYMRHVPRRVL